MVADGWYQRERAAIPSVSINASPGGCVFVSDEWWPLIVGLLEPGLRDSFWDSSTGAVAKGVDGILRLATQELGGCVMASGLACYHQASGVTGGGSAAGYNARSFNRFQGLVTDWDWTQNPTFRPTAGTYAITVIASCFRVDLTKLMLLRVSDGAVIINGLNGRARDFGANSNPHNVICEGVFEADGLTDYRITHYCGRAQASNGLGQPLSLAGIEEVYCQMLVSEVQL